MECMRVYPKSFLTGRVEGELQMVQFSATRCSFIAILLVSLVSSATITFCVASQRVFVVVYFFNDSVRKLLDTPSYINNNMAGVRNLYLTIILVAITNESREVNLG
jgi:hypothetical protein